MAVEKGNSTGSRITMANDGLRLVVETAGGLQPARLVSVQTGFAYANMPYLYRVGRTWETPALTGKSMSSGGEGSKLHLEGRLGEVVVEHDFFLPSQGRWMEERLKLRNNGSAPLDTSRAAMGFARTLNDKDLEGDLKDCRISAVPFRRDLLGRRGEYLEYDFPELILNGGTYCPRWPRRRPTPEMGSEGWAWVGGRSSLLIAKHSPGAIEFSVLSTEGLGELNAIRFGGASIWHGDPEEGTHLGPGESFEFSPTRYESVEGGIREAYYAFRSYMESLGHGTPENFDPPVHWNELYDNPLWWTKDDFNNRQKLYTLAHMEEEASKARELGCESLYLDPGWDTSFGSSIWPSYRLLKADEFVKLMREKYGLGVSLHMPLAVWCDSTAYPLSAHRRNGEGGLEAGLCSASPGYMETKRERLLELARAGFVYYMFDGTAYTGECWDPDHGHSLPLRRSEHCRSIHDLARAVHEEYPDIIIELHDPILGGVPERYAPMHYLHGLPGGFDEGWGFEYMWDPMEDIISGRAISLYYYNLAYSLPLYLHIDLRKDNANALEFWWYASTCRHLGVGGKHGDPAVWEAHRDAMRHYRRLKAFFTRGIFLGYGEEVHLHLLPEGAVLNVFNLDSKAHCREIEIPVGDLGFSVGEVSDGDWELKGGRLKLSVTLGSRDAMLIEISP